MKQRLQAMPVIGTALAVQQRYQQDAADPLAAAIGFFGFLSLFPLLLLTVSAAGFVLDDPADQVAVAEAITGAIPGFDEVEGESGVDALVSGVVEQRGTIGLVGAVILLLSGLRVVNAAMIATRVVFRSELLTGVGAKVRQLLALVVLGTVALAGAAASSLAGVGLGALPLPLALLISVSLTFAVDLVMFLGAYVLLAPTAPLSVRDRIPGAVLAAAGWTGLKVAGASYVGGQVENANALYGALGGVIALMLLFYLAGRFYLYGAQLSAIRYERRHGPLVAPDQAPVVAVAAPADAPDGHGDDGPPPPPAIASRPRPADPGPAAAAPTIGEGTRQRLGEPADADGGRDLRTAAAFALTIGALAAGWRLLGGRDG